MKTTLNITDRDSNLDLLSVKSNTRVRRRPDWRFHENNGGTNHEDRIFLWHKFNTKYWHRLNNLCRWWCCQLHGPSGWRVLYTEERVIFYFGCVHVIKGVEWSITGKGDMGLIPGGDDGADMCKPSFIM
uniref:Uncharacterized protein n=1 Tax=Timema poppense TaxID=170557 RepID=A0A7R9CIX1_TIMPO|nr:unnamed protein product [Timema poppensis]